MSALHRGSGRLGPEEIGHGGCWRDIGPLLERPERVVEQPVEGHGACLGAADGEGGWARGCGLGEPSDDETEPHRALGTAPRVQAPTRAGKARERPADACPRGGGRGAADTPTASLISAKPPPVPGAA